jgi:hypothetical protein
MTTWTSDELNKIGKSEELQIASLRRYDTLRNPVTIWVVRVGDDLYIRSACSVVFRRVARDISALVGLIKMLLS